MMTIGELLGVGTWENLNTGMFILHCIIMLFLLLVPFTLGELTGKKVFYALTVSCLPTYIVILAALSAFECHNTPQAMRLIIYAAAGFAGYGILVVIRLRRKKGRRYNVPISVDTIRERDLQGG